MTANEQEYVAARAAYEVALERLKAARKPLGRELARKLPSPIRGKTKPAVARKAAELGVTYETIYILMRLT